LTIGILIFTLSADVCSAAGLKGRRVLEVGLGYGSLLQKVAEFGATYTGLEIAVGPVGMVNHRLVQSGLPGKAFRAACLSVRFPINRSTSPLP
jgi:cyclopropane fatty-acyl-phospholipid synthase-like methyltransferase